MTMDAEHGDSSVMIELHQEVMMYALRGGYKIIFGAIKNSVLVLGETQFALNLSVVEDIAVQSPIYITLDFGNEIQTRRM